MALIGDKKGLSENEITAVLHHVQEGFTDTHSVKEHNALYDENGRCILCKLEVPLVVTDAERL